MTRSTGDSTVIVGGGLTGISAAIHLDVEQAPYLLVERADALGGLARTEEHDGFFFDVTGHWLHLRDPEIKALVLDLMGDELVLVQRISRIVSCGVQTRYPFQGNLHGLPPQVASACLLGFIQAKMGGPDSSGSREGGGVKRRVAASASKIDNFEDYILRHFGAGIAEHFMIPYNTKLWGVHPREISSAWCSRFVPIPSLEQVVAGAVGAAPDELGYNVSFYYPRQGGIETFSSALAGKVDPARVQLNTAVTRVDPAARTVTLGDAEPRRYAALISTMPLPELVGCLVDPPAEVRDAARSLRATTLRYLNVATRTRAPSKYHWAYVPEERFPFYRVGVFSNAVASMAPPGCSSLYVELASREAPGSHAALVEEVAPALVEAGALTAVEDLLFADERVIDHAYVVFDQHYHAALETIFPYLESQRIYSRGRYGSWIYNSMEDSLIAGREVARSVSALLAEDRASDDPTREQRM